MMTVYDKNTVDVCYTCKNECKKAAGTFNSWPECKNHDPKEWVEHADILNYSDIVLRIADRKELTHNLLYGENNNGMPEMSS